MDAVEYLVQSYMKHTHAYKAQSDTLCLQEKMTKAWNEDDADK